MFYELCQITVFHVLHNKILVFFVLEIIYVLNNVLRIKFLQRFYFFLEKVSCYWY